MEIWVSAITHKHGTSVYTAVSRALLIHALYEYVEAWWSQEFPKTPFPENGSEEAIVDCYFEAHEYETLEFIKETELAGSIAEAEQQPKDPELIKLRSVVCDLSDVLEAHAVHGDHSDAQLQEWADTGRRAIGEIEVEE